MSDTATKPTANLTPRMMWLALGMVLITAFLLRLNELGQLQVKDLDEAFHAIVARSMMRNPLYPMLYERPFLPFDPTNWLSNSIWLHKPPVALWHMALSMSLLGESNFTMRFPSLLLSTGAVALTFLIGRSLGDVRAGLFASILQALNPAITRFVHGQVFSDHVDIAMLFYCELAVWCLIHATKRSGSRWAILTGAAMGLAYLSKSFPCLFILGLAMVFRLSQRVPRLGTALTLSGRQLTAIVWSSVAVALPWTLWCWTMFPREFAHEQLYVFQHLTTDIETFAGPWDRLWFEYLFRALLEWYPLALVAMLYVACDAWRTSDGRRWFVVLWALGVIVPHTLAVSKTPSATLTAWPALWLAIGIVLSDATRGRSSAIAIAAGAALLIAFWPQFPVQLPVLKEDYTFAKIMLVEWRVLVHVGALLVAGLIAARFMRDRRLRPLYASFLLAAVLGFPIARHARIGFLTSDDVDSSAVAFPMLGKFVREKAPPEAVFFVQSDSRNAYVIAMWWLDRSCYPLRKDRLEMEVAKVRERGGRPFILSRTPREEPMLVNIPGEAAIYSLDPRAGDAPK